MIHFSRYRFISLIVSFFLMVGFYFVTFKQFQGFARSMDFDGGIQLELEFPEVYKVEQVRDFFSKLQPAIEVQVTSYTDSKRNIYKIEAGRDVVEKLEGVDEFTRKANSSIWNYLKSFIISQELKVEVEKQKTDNVPKKDETDGEKDDKKSKKKIKKNKKGQKNQDSKKEKKKKKKSSSSGADAITKKALEQDALKKLHAMVASTWEKEHKGKTDAGEIVWVHSNKVGPTVGISLRKNALNLLLVTMLFIIVYLTVRFEFRFGVAALVALLHDLLIVWGIVGIMQLKPSIPLIAAMLTILGYSINDTIVIFDRIRENMKGNKKMPMKAIVDVSINQSINRTLITSITTLVSVTCLYFFGGSELRDFSIVLLFGVLVGTYSSVFIASPVLIIWDSIKAFTISAEPESGVQT
jgi:preprotein translocase SecF subunit